MSSELRRWLADRLPEGMTSSERLVLLEIADWAHNETRLAYGAELADTLTRRTGLSPRDVAKNLAKIAEKYGVSFRVPVTNRDGTVKTDKAGRVVYAYRSQQTTHEVPARLPWGTRIHDDPGARKDVPRDLNG